MSKLQSRAMEQRREAESLAQNYPALLAEAERVAAIVSQGIHGRRRAGQGETFWQYRPYQSADGARQIDWRRSGRTDQLYVRDNEWEAANSLYFWRDGSPGMDWKSLDRLPTKKQRASVICMAMAILLMRAGERCAVIGESGGPRAGRAGLERITRRLADSPGLNASLDGKIPSHAQLLLASDFLEGADIWRKRLTRLASRPAKGALIRIIDPAEYEFPYRGRLDMRLPGEGSPMKLRIGRAEQAQDEYKRKFQAHGAALAELARHLGWPLITHRTDSPPQTALGALYAVISGDMD